MSTSAAPPLYRHSNPITEAYGFSLAIFALVLWTIWSAWALSPEWLLQAIGIEWFPNRDWAYLLPAWSIMLCFFIYVGFFSLNLFRTPPLDAVELVTERLSVAEMSDVRGPLSDDVYDISPGLVSRMRYLYT